MGNATNMNFLNPLHKCKPLEAVHTVNVLSDVLATGYSSAVSSASAAHFIDETLCTKG